MERIVGSGSEPTYLPLTNTSLAGLELYFLVCARAPEAVPRITTRAMKVFNIRVSSGWSLHLHQVCPRSRPLETAGKSRGCPGKYGSLATRKCRKTPLIAGFRRPRGRCRADAPVPRLKY